MGSVFLGVNTQALSHKLNLKAIYVLNKSSNGRQELLSDVPVVVDLKARVFLGLLNILVWRVGQVTNGYLLGGVLRLTNDVP